ncbi:hypothetical protein [Roseivirga sp. UBA1976]|uniref:hypothetical protein n=1 Tax=Roseivirga sp. UBA1976 TaxID=1947386 RepID=UPI00257AB925|nr:hypothetical protein [Roseivirga sp. UBA1976]MEC7755345.1 hypothetical protein [Bacteroidota bacterium]|tara:strand:+ start:786 stop:1586 length:801 start_codon:yes stop_codon:yes gene_type:complete
MKDDIQMLSKSLLEAMSQILGVNLQSENYIKAYSVKIEKAFSDNPISQLTSNYILHNLRAKSLQESGQIFLGYSYGTNNAKATLQVSSNLQFYFLLSLAHAYELFEIYIKRLLKVIEKEYPEIRDRIKPSELKKNCDPSVDNIQTKNNKAYFNLLRRIMPSLVDIETKNCWNTDIQQWYQAFSNFRHSVTHGNALCHETKYLKYKKLTDQFFPVKKHCEDPDCKFWRFDITYSNLNDNLTLIGDYTILLVEELNSYFEIEIDLKKL